MKTTALRSILIAQALAAGLLAQSAVAMETPPKEPITPYESEGCWVAVFAGANYRPPTARMIGPTYLENFMTGPVVSQDLREVGGQDFMTEVESLIVGPRARFEVFDRENFGGEVDVFEPDRRVPDLSGYRFPERAKSARVRCEPEPGEPMAPG